MADVLVFAPHPDDAEIHCGGTIAAHVRQGAKVVVVDATQGELGSRGTPATRAQEAEAASDILGLSARENLQLPDGHIPSDDTKARALIVDAIRRHRPQTVLCINEQAHHPDHQALARLVSGAIKAAALHKFPTPSNTPAVSGVRLWYYEAELPMLPTILVPLTQADWDKKIAAITCYGSQLHKPGSTEPITTIADPAFMKWIEARGVTWGYQAGAEYAEAFTGLTAARISNLQRI